MDNTSFFFTIFNLNEHFPLLDRLMVFATSDLIYILFLIVFILAIKGGIKEKKSFLLILFAMPLAILLIKLIHLFFFEPRPFVTFHLTPIANESADSASFPSRHATMAAVIAFAYTYFKSKWSLLFLSMMLLIGISRIYVGVHYPLDVLGGFVAGVISLVLAKYLINFLKLRFFRQSL